MSSHSTIFDALSDVDTLPDELPPGKEGYFELASRAPDSKDDSFLNRIAEYGKTFLKGGIEGLKSFGRMMGPLEPLPADLEEIRKEKEESALEELLPTGKETFGQRALRRGIKEVPSALAFPGSVLASGARALGAGALEESAQELGAPEWVQTAAGLTAYLGPDLTKKLLERGKTKDIIQAARRMGLSDEQITPLIQSETKQKWLSKLATKRGSTQERLQETKQGLSKAYSGLQRSETAAQEISEQANGTLINEIFETLNELPRELRGKIEPDLKDLLSNKVTGRSLMNFFSDINSKYSGDRSKLSLLKEPIRKALGSISPELANDFGTVNRLYSLYFPIASKLKPTIASDIVSAAETIGVLGALGGTTFGFFHPLVAILGEQTAKKLAQQFLINPRFQQLSQKMVVALNQNKYQMAKNILGQITNQISKFDPESAETLKDLSMEELEDLFKYQKKGE